MAGQNAALLVAVGQEEVLARESPVEESPVHGLIHHLEEPGFADAQQRRLGRCHQAVFRIVVDEHFLGVARFVRERNITVRKQHFVVVFVFQIETVVRYAADGKGVVAACFEHGSWD